MADSLLTTLYGMLDKRSITGVADSLGVSEQSATQGLLGAHVRQAAPSGSTIRDVTSSTNCASGFQVNTGSNNLLENNVSIRNGNVTAACGGI